MKLKIKVTKDIIRKSMWCKSDFSVYQNCAIALAVRDIFPDAYTHTTYINPFEETMNCQRIWLPEGAKQFIRDFDDAKDRPTDRLFLNEFVFTVELHESVIEAINIEDIHRSLNLELV